LAAEKGEYMRPSTLELVEEYMKTAESMDLAESTREQKKQIFEEINELFEYADEFDLNTYRLHLLENGRKKKTGRRKVTVNSYVKMARPVFHWAIRQGWIADDPFEGVRKFRIPQGRIHVFKPCQIEAMLASANDIWRARILASVTAGLRRSEVLNLTLDDINFEDGIIYVQPKRDTLETWEWWPKNRKHRTVPLTSTFYNFLVSKTIPSLPAGQQYCTLSSKRHWTLQKRRPLSYRIRVTPDENFKKPFDRIIDRANDLLPVLDKIKHGTFHDLRRTCITRWTQNRDLSPQEVQLLAGHADIKTTMEYYAAIRTDVCQRAKKTTIGATGLEPATS
jgi:integrase